MLNESILTKPSDSSNTLPSILPLSNREAELELLLLKRPREEWQTGNTGARFNRPRILLSPVDNNEDTEAAIDLAGEELNEASLAISDFKLKTNIDHLNKNTPTGGKRLRLVRSASFSTPLGSGEWPTKRNLERQLTRERNAGRCLSILIADKKNLLRRASVWNESPPATLLTKSPFVGIQSVAYALEV